jgi:hypothetical protein
MFSTYDSLEQLFQAVETDKLVEGHDSFVANRYPIRFVLFDNFKDCYSFVEKISNSSTVVRLSGWMDQDYPDAIITHSKLFDTIKVLSEKVVTDIVIAPFSELARFYDNEKFFEFNALISTIKAIENDKAAFESHRRIYIPVVGLNGKMSKFSQDTQSIMWYFHSNIQQLNYRLIMTDGKSFGVKNLESKYTYINSVKQWLDAWNNHDLKQDIICTSRSLYANAHCAQPDNAFTFCTCQNVYQFLTDGLKLNLRFIPYKETEKDYWEKLASEINVCDFNFEQFFNSKFDIHELASYKVFMKTWFEFQTSYERWLLSAFYQYKFCNKGYICTALQMSKGYTNVDLVESLLLSIFNIKEQKNQEDSLEERMESLFVAQKNGVVISQEAQNLLQKKLRNTASEKGYLTAMRYFTSTSQAELSLLIEWLGENHIQVDDIKTSFPDLYFYMQPTEDIESGKESLLVTYINEYKKAKIADHYSEEIKKLIHECNENEVTFNSWYQDFKTTRTILSNRDDIEVFFWIDGLGIDWMPFVKAIIEERKNDNFFLNESYVAKALLPTTTSKNKENLLLLADNNLPKIGDIDAIAHQSRKYPDYLISDMKIVRDSINEVLTKNPGRKIAIVSDHGMSFLPKLGNGLNLAGVESDHGGRIAYKKNGKPTNDTKYIILDDDKTMCALQHDSLCAKIPAGCGCHGGCTPEEVLVPIFIISNQPNKKFWTAVLLTQEVSAANPFAQFKIKGIDPSNKISVLYDGHSYNVSKISGDTYQTDALQLNAGISNISVQIEGSIQTFKISVKAGAEEEDLFDDF